MTEKERLTLLQSVFDKLEKYARISRLEKALGLDEEKHLHAYLEAWEGPEQEQSTPADFFSTMMKQQSTMSAYGGFNSMAHY